MHTLNISNIVFVFLYAIGTGMLRILSTLLHLFTSHTYLELVCPILIE